jgi:hypothetical protein
MHLPFLTPRIDLLGSDGSIQTLHPGSRIGRLRKPVVLLARDLCAFSLFAAAALPRGRRRSAARLHARLASPYITGGAALVAAGNDIGIWWWDLHRVAPALTERYGATLPVLRPETLAQPYGEGWRIVRLATGYEAQLWRGRALIASAWRRERYDASSWRAFTSLQRVDDAPATPPAPQTLPVALDSEAFSVTAAEISREQAMAGAAAGFAVAACVFAAFVLGQGMSLGDATENLRAETAALRASTPSSASLRGVETDRQRLVAFREIEERTNPVTAAGAAIGIVALHDLTPSAVDVEDGTLSITLPYAAVEDADTLIGEFENSGYFYDVRPRTEASTQTLVMEMKVREAAPPLSAAG